MIVIKPNVKLECVPKFCYLGGTLKTKIGRSMPNVVDIHFGNGVFVFSIY